MGNSESKFKATKLHVALLGLIVTAAGAFYFACAHRLPATTAPSTRPLALMHLEPFVVNLADDDHTYLRIGIDLGVRDDASSNDKKDRGDYSTAVSRDTILAVVTARHSQQLVTAADKQSLKKELQEALNARAPELGVREVYFTEFLLQR
jgi:flagellar FliL protein